METPVQADKANHYRLINLFFTEAEVRVIIKNTVRTVTVKITGSIVNYWRVGIICKLMARGRGCGVQGGDYSTLGERYCWTILRVS